ncbi:MAG: T9SS type A sorting domain-containing protein [Flavobacteriaceae bacterium]
MKKITFLAALLISAASFAQIIGFTSFEEPGTTPGVQYTDTGDPAVAHDLINNVGEPEVDFTSTGTELGFNARYTPYDAATNGLTDGDWVGVTDFTGDVTAFTDGTKGYGIGDVDGNYILEFDTVDLTGYSGVTLGIDYYINVTGYEGDGTLNEEGSDRMRIYVKDLTNGTEIDVLNTEGSDINDLLIEGTWQNGSVNLPSNITAQLVVEVRTNSGSEVLYLDHIVIDGILANNDFISNTFSIYPNPANGYVNITSQTSGDKNVAVYDILGKQVINTTISSDRLNISELTSGIYIMQISQNGVSSTKKLVVR